ncbi:MAG TPA: transcription termination factor Rho [Bacteroidota bacterium]|nr:transcription termination factor Rho [Bacteroidota bacterium]
MTFQGILEIEGGRGGFVRTRSLTVASRPTDPYVTSASIARFSLREGVFLEGDAEERRGKSPHVRTIASVNGVAPEVWKAFPEVSQHEPVSPHEALRLEGPGCNVSMRLVGLFCPIGKGQRALIVSPPKAGKTILLQHLAHAVSTFNPEIDLIVLLVDERPEELTEMKRAIRGEVFGSSSDTERGDQVRLAKLVLEYAKRKVETGRDVVLLLDSLTRLGRAFNIHQRGSGRTMSGGVDARALEIPKRIFGAARKLEDAGSLTIIATALIETNSRMDELIFQEFKGTGNMELVLDRKLAEERLFPAINLSLSGTRREELLFGGEASRYQNLRRSIARLNPREALLAVLRLTGKYPTNEELVSRF